MHQRAAVDIPECVHITKRDDRRYEYPHRDGYYQTVIVNEVARNRSRANFTRILLDVVVQPGSGGVPRRMDYFRPPLSMWGLYGQARHAKEANIFNIPILPLIYSRHDCINLNFRPWSWLVAVIRVSDREKHSIRREKVKRHRQRALEPLAAHS